MHPLLELAVKRAKLMKETEKMDSKKREQADRLEVLRNDRLARLDYLKPKETSTYHQQAQTSEVGGRFASQNKPIVSGAQATVQYPRQPANSPWAQPDAGIEPPLNVDLNYVEPCGTEAEIRASIDQLQAQALADPLVPDTSAPLSPARDDTPSVAETDGGALTQSNRLRRI
jgi:hypothetical protein